MGHKGRYWLVHEECIVHTAVCQKAHLGTKRCQTVKKNQAHSLSRYRVMVGIRQFSLVSLLVSESVTNSVK